MTNKFSLVDDESGLTIGKSFDLIGLTGDCIEKIDDEDFNKITLIHFQYDEEFVAYCTGNKRCINNLYLTILDNKENPIGSYYYVLKEPHYYPKFSEFDEVISQFELIGDLHQVATEESLLVWNMRRTPLSKRNEWIELTQKQRVGWLEVARLSHQTNPLDQDQKYENYHMDLALVTDSISFFCALGEAINGPGGYFGYDLYSLTDCLCGGFGASVPFTIHVHNETSINDSFFHQIIKILTDRSVSFIHS